MTELELEQYLDLKKERDHLKDTIVIVDALYKKTRNETDEELLNHYNYLTRRLTKQLTKIENAIETLDPRERQALRLHYIEGMTWEEVARLMYYERAQIYRIRKAALAKLEDA